MTGKASPSTVGEHRWAYEFPPEAPWHVSRQYSAAAERWGGMTTPRKAVAVWADSDEDALAQLDSARKWIAERLAR
jgi:hypothetical protein